MKNNNLKSKPILWTIKDILYHKKFNNQLKQLDAQLRRVWWEYVIVTSEEEIFIKITKIKEN